MNKENKISEQDKALMQEIYEQATLENLSDSNGTRQYVINLAMHLYYQRKQQQTESFLPVLEENYQATLRMPFSNIIETERRVALFETYQDLISIYKNGSWHQQESKAVEGVISAGQWVKAESALPPEDTRVCIRIKRGEQWDYESSYRDKIEHQILRDVQLFIEWLNESPTDKSDAVEFAEWISANGYCKLSDREWQIDLGEPEYKITELYSIFQKSKS